MKTVAIVALEGLFDSSFTVTLDILRTAKQIHLHLAGGTVNVDTVICSNTKQRQKTSAGLEFRAHRTPQNMPQADVVIVPGLGIIDPSRFERVLASENAREIIDFLKQQAQQGSLVTASCSATFLLAESGLPDGKAATTSWWLADAFRERYPTIDLQVDKMLVSGPGYLCAGAAMAQADLMMKVITLLYGSETARLTANYMLIDQRQYQSQYVMAGMVTQRHPEVAKAERWIRDNLTRDFSVSDLASAVGTSERTLARRIQKVTGGSPLRLIQQLRLEYAIHLLETTTRPFETIAADVGYADASSLRRLLQRQTGKTPSQFRQSIS